MQSAIEFSISHTRAMLLALFAILVAGLVIYNNAPKEAEPEIEIPIIYISMTHDGISPEDAERLLVRPMEQELRSLEGIKEMTASAYQGGANVQLEFMAGVDTDLALQDVREKVDAAQAELPAETEEPSVQEVKFARFDPMMVINLAGNLPERTLVAIAEDLKDEIESLTGVLEVNMAGNREEMVEIVIDPLLMESYSLRQDEILNIVSRNNRLVAAGSLQSEAGQFPVKVPGVFETTEDMLSLPVKTDGQNIVELRDVASVRRTYKDAQSYARLNGKPAIAIEVVQRGGANILETTANVRDILNSAEQQWPPGTRAIISRDKSKDVRTMLTELQNNVLSAVVLVFIVLVGILGLRSASLVGIAIPGSFLLAIMTIVTTGISINMMVLFGLIMAVGLLVDGAVVVTELADRKMAEGDSRAKAYMHASKRMAGPIVASTMTTLAAFLPLAFWPGVPGEFMKYLPITLIFVLTASLLMALMFVPTLGSLFGKPGSVNEDSLKALAAAETGNLDDVKGGTGWYLHIVERALKAPFITAAIMFVVLVVIYIAYGAFGKGTEYFPEVEPEFVTVDIRARGDYSAQEKDAIVRQVENRILDLGDIDTLYAKSGKTGDNAADDQIGLLQLNLKDWQIRRPADEILKDIRTRTADLAGIHIDARKPAEGPQQGKPMAVQLAHNDPDVLRASADTLIAEMSKMGGIINIEDDRPLPGIEWTIKVDRPHAARFGADVSLVGSTVQLVTNGIKLAEFRPDDSDEEIDIRARYPEAFRNLDEIDALRVPTPGGGNVPLSTFVERTAQPKVGTIRRTDMRRTLTIQADTEEGVLVSDRVQELSQRLPDLGLNPTLGVAFKGSFQEEQEAGAFLGTAFLVALALMAIILVTQFNSIYQMILVLTAVVFSTGGVFLGHLILAQPFGTIMSGIGVIALAGVVVNNNIVFIDTFNVLQKRGLAPYEAVLRTCAQRLRPVMLTTVTTILGLVPMVIGANINLIDREVTMGAPSSQWWTQLSASIAGGLLFATTLTLILTPCLLWAPTAIRNRFRKN